jgi:pimeloyl-ACP methyl ester carboxylesterase
LEISRNNNVAQWQEVLKWLEKTPVIKKIPGDQPYQLFEQWNNYVDELVYAIYPPRSPKVGDYAKVILSSPYNLFPAILSNGPKEDIGDRIQEEEKQDPLLGKLGRIDHQKLLLLTGRFDERCVPEEMEYAFQQITSANKKALIIDKAGHEIFANEPQQLIDAVKNFIQ